MADGFVELTPETIIKSTGVAELNRMLKTLFDLVAGDGKDVKVLYGYGSPEGVIVASVGAIYMRKDGGAGTSVYIKESGTQTATGWVAK